MTVIVAEQKNVRQSSRKVRLVANQVKKLSLTAAIEQLAVMERRSSLVVLKVIKQALANATKNLALASEDLELADIVVEDGAILRRMRAVSRGRGHGIDKRTCHVRVTLKTKDESAVAKQESVAQEVVASEEGKK